MNSKYLIAWAAYVAVTFVLGYLWHLVLFKRTYRELGIFSRIDDPVIPLGLGAMLIQGAILAYLYPLFPKGNSVLAEGLKFGLVFGAFIASSAVFAEAAKQKVSSLPTWLVLETVYYAIQFSLAGMSIALIYGKQA